MSVGGLRGWSIYFSSLPQSESRRDEDRPHQLDGRLTSWVAINEDHGGHDHALQHFVPRRAGRVEEGEVWIRGT